VSRRPTREWAAALAPLTHLTDAEAARALGCAPSTVARVRRAHPELAGPKGRPGPAPTRAPTKAKPGGPRRGRPAKGREVGRTESLTVRASEAELERLGQLAEALQTDKTTAVHAAVERMANDLLG